MEKGIQCDINVLKKCQIFFIDLEEFIQYGLKKLHT